MGLTLILSLHQCHILVPALSVPSVDTALRGGFTPWEQSQLGLIFYQAPEKAAHGMLVRKPEVSLVDGSVIDIFRKGLHLKGGNCSLGPAGFFSLLLLLPLGSQLDSDPA